MNHPAEYLKPTEFFAPDNTDLMLADDCVRFHHDPLAWVMWAFDWGYGELDGFTGPDVWQVDWLTEFGNQLRERDFDGVMPVMPVRMTTSSGHGIGKSALVAWVILFIMSARPFSKGIVTANTGDQLRTKTWGELSKWKARCLTGHWFELNSGKGSLSMYHKSWPETWRVDAQTCREENSEAFAGLHAANSTPFYIFDEACHDDQTEVLTRTGWKLFKDVTPVDELLTMNTDTREAYYDRPTQLHVSDYIGEMLTTDIRGCSFSVTPNHRMLFESRKLKALQFKSAGEMRWNNKKMMRHIERNVPDQTTFTIPEYSSRRVDYPALTVRMDDWMEFMGWFITEGHTVSQSWVRKCGTFQREAVGAVITQKQEHNTDEIEQLAQRMGINHTRRSTGVWFHSPALAHYLNKVVGKGFAGKRVPGYVFDLSPRQINCFLDAAIKGDGYNKDNRRILYTSSPALAEDYNRLALLSGVNSTICKRNLEGVQSMIGDRAVTSSCDGYSVSITDRPTYIDCDKASPSKTHYVGKVYCATISGGVLYTRRNGQTLWSGNSAVPDKIWEVAEGGLTDGEPVFCCFGNPTRNTGKFAETLNASSRWTKRQIDSRTAKMTNKKQIQEWLDDHGEDSDFFRVRVRGVLPRAGDMQFIPGDIVSAAMKRGPGRYIGNDPLICGIDMARGGADDCRIGFRRGMDAKSEQAYRIPGEKSRDSMKVVSMITMVLQRHKPDVIFVDETGIGGPIVDRLRQLGYNAIGINFGGMADDKQHYVNKTAEMGARVRQWLMDGGAIPDDPQLERELTVREFWHNDKDQLVLERKDDLKKRLGVSPDWADQLYLTFAQDVAPLSHERGLKDVAPHAREYVVDRRSGDYDPLDNL